MQSMVIPANTFFILSHIVSQLIARICFIAAVRGLLRAAVGREAHRLRLCRRRQQRQVPVSSSKELQIIFSYSVTSIKYIFSRYKMAAAVCVIWKKGINLSKSKRQPDLVAAEGEHPIRKRYSQPTNICFISFPKAGRAGWHLPHWGWAWSAAKPYRGLSERC